MRQPGLKSFALLAGLTGLLAAPGARAAGIDWGSVPGKEVVLFYPGQASWEWSLTPDDMSGATKFRQEGKSCAECHDGEEKGMGEHLVTGKPRLFKTVEKPSIEPAPIAGKPGSITATVKFANDGTNLYVHLDVKDGNQPDARQDPAVATRVTVMFSKALASDVARGGCFAACHDDMTAMPSANGAARSHYLAATHAKLTRQGAGDALKPAADLAKLKADGYFLEDWQARINPGQAAKPAGYVIFAKRDEASLPITAEGSSANGITSVTLSSKLAPGGEFIGFAPGTTYRVAFAVHDGHTAGRFHYISLERTLVIDSGTADFIAVKK
jgi:Ethylbenzene dehydrogenase